MTRDEIIKLASQAIDDTRSEVDLPVPFVLRFAALVAAAEREACAKACDERAEAWRAAHIAGQRAMQDRAAELCEQFSLAVLESEWANGYAAALKDAACGIRALEVKP